MQTIRRIQLLLRYIWDPRYMFGVLVFLFDMRMQRGAMRFDKYQISWLSEEEFRLAFGTWIDTRLVLILPVVLYFAGWLNNIQFAGRSVARLRNLAVSHGRPPSKYERGYWYSAFVGFVLPPGLCLVLPSGFVFTMFFNFFVGGAILTVMYGYLHECRLS